MFMTTLTVWRFSHIWLPLDSLDFQMIPTRSRPLCAIVAGSITLVESRFHPGSTPNGQALS